MQGQEGPAWCFPQRSLLCSSHTSTSTSCEISLSNQSHNHTSLYHNSMSLSLHWRILTKILCPTDSDIYSLCVCDTCKAELGKCSAVVSPPLARRLLPYPPPPAAAAAKRPHQAAPGPPPGPIRRNCWGQAKDYFDHHVTRSG